MATKLLLAVALIFGPMFYAAHTTADRWIERDRILLSVCFFAGIALILAAVALAA